MINQHLQSLDLMLCFIAWLSVVGRMSREKCQVTRNYLLNIIKLSKLVNNQHQISQQIPKDVRAVVNKLDLNPELNQYICFPKFYSTYDFEVHPHGCQYKIFPTSPPCESIKTCKISLITTNDSVYNYQQSQAWDALYPKCQQKSSSPLQLAFSLFTEWFNLLSNKAAGKQFSLGVLALNCLNLPPTSQGKAQNTFLSGLVPEPSQPKMMKINNILKNFVDEVVQLDSEIIIQTPCYPHSQRVIVHLGCLIGDLVANHKVAGFASHFATRFCSWCNCPKADIQEIKLGRIGQKSHVKDYSRAFQELKNESECTRMVKRNGIRWSELNRLHYWDPVQQIPLGIMHNWFEGILQHHF
ncbi:hypothetical protein O181_042221 [Austropuccinia psidii MF-1]|uniref:Uncharacterized protein n=1 Tax=Austropuccinia psidii MF-1 TaxID=1389203 RepID=A0A9Q3DL81_9BASI|nr:hypothetical protein [Austropuccinia psidii MF-1]